MEALFLDDDGGIALYMKVDPSTRIVKDHCLIDLFLVDNQVQTHILKEMLSPIWKP